MTESTIAEQWDEFERNLYAANPQFPAPLAQVLRAAFWTGAAAFGRVLARSASTGEFVEGYAKASVEVMREAVNLWEGKR